MIKKLAWAMIIAALSSACASALSTRGAND
ncbi:MAG: hypothetical protein ACI9EF_003303 [Pseudohongiellaceae bacterium]|jgi:hypothetical protein